MSGPRRATIGVLYESLLGGCEEEVWVTISQAAKSLDVNLVHLIGNGVRADGDALYAVAEARTVDAVIGISSSLGTPRGGDALRRLYERFRPRPVVSVGKRVPGTTSLLIRGDEGIRKIVSHLVEVHGRSRIAFICGPAESEEAQDRFTGYRQALEDHGIPFRPELITVGDFTRAPAIQAIRTLRERDAPFDALVAANDYMAIHAMRELQRSGRRVPDDVAIAGFDDLPETVAVTPMLTTARQPLRAVGTAAVRTALALLRGEGAPERLDFEAEMVVRESCGCLESAQRRAGRPVPGRPAATTRAPRGETAAAQLRADFPEVTEVVQSDGWADELLEILQGELRGARGDRLLPALEALISSFDPRRGVAAQFRDVLDAAFDLLAPEASGPGRDRWQEVRDDALAALAILAEQRQMRFSVLRAAGYQGVINTYYWNVILDQEQLRRSLLSGLLELGIESLFVGRYLEGSRVRAAAVLRFGGYERKAYDFSLDAFDLRALVESLDTQERRHDRVIFSMLSSPGQDGFAIFETVAMRSMPDPSLVHELRRRLSVSALMTELARHAGELEVRVAERTRELQEAQSKLLEAAHQAGMAEIAVGALHNVGNLLNSVIVSAESAGETLENSRIDGLLKANELLRAHEDDLADFFARDPKARLLPRYYAKLAAGLLDEWTRVRSTISELLERTGLIRETVRSLQEYAHDGLDILLREETDLVGIAELSLGVESTQIARHSVQVFRDYDRDAPRPVLPRTKVVHVVVNLVKNAIDALAGVPLEERRLTIQVRCDRGRAQLRVRDTGVGIPPENMEKVFTYGFTTKAAGHGFGLHTCANYVKQMGGTLTVESGGPGRGATFTVTFE